MRKIGIISFLVIAILMGIVTSKKEAPIVLSDKLLEIASVEVVSNDNSYYFNVEDCSQWISATLMEEYCYDKRYFGDNKDLDHLYFKNDSGEVVKEVDLYRDTKKNQLGVVLDEKIYVDSQWEFTLEKYLEQLKFQKMVNGMKVVG
jgi:hypothetical protein